MTFERFVAVVAAGDEQEQSSSFAIPGGFDRVFVGKHLKVFAPVTARRLVIPGERGVLFGHPLGRHDDYALVDERHLSSIPDDLAQAANWLGQNIWGPYVAIMTGFGGRATLVCRDPGGMQPCYYIKSRDQWVFGSYANDLITATGLPLCFDWPALAAHMRLPDRRIERTGLEGVREILAGTGLEIGAAGAAVLALWSPWRHCARDRLILDEAAATTLVRTEAIKTARAVCRGARHVLLGLSGGLDSSIVAACLSTLGQKFSALTLSTKARSGDERDYARLVAGHLGIQLFEREERADFVDLLHSDASHLPRPVSRNFAQSGDRISRELAVAIGSDAFIYGGGGDNVFCFLQSTIPVADRILAHGPGPGALAAARDVAEMADCSIVKALTLGVRRALRRPWQYRWMGSDRFLSQRAISMAIHDRHPWQLAPTRMLPGQSNHVVWLLGFQNHLEGYGREQTNAMLFPLVSQPLVEACLRIPSWLWCRGGINRSIARRAFADLLPSAIIARRMKGTPDSFILELADTRRSLIREILGDGILRQNDMIGFEEIDLSLRNSTFTSIEAMRLMMLVDIEAWLRAWSTSASQQPRPAHSAAPEEQMVRDSGNPH